MASVESSPPPLRKAGVREILEGLPAAGQVGGPPSMNTDANLGFCSVGYQISEVAFAQCDIKGNILVRLASRTSRRRQGNKKDLGQRAEVIYWPCCATVTQCASGVAPVALRGECLSQSAGRASFERIRPHWAVGGWRLPNTARVTAIFLMVGIGPPPPLVATCSEAIAAGPRACRLADSRCATG